MKSFWAVVASVTLAIASIWTTLFLLYRPTTEATFYLLETWRDSVRHFTPESWHVQGNIPLGLLIAISGVLFYSVIIGFVLATCWLLFSKAKKNFWHASKKR